MKWFLRRKRQRVVANHILQAIENERDRIAKELHDSVGQALYSVLVGVKIVTKLKIDESVREHFLQVEQLTAKALDEVKRMAHELRPLPFDDLGLIPALETYLERYEYTFGIRTKFVHNGTGRRYSKPIETSLYRICQEALTNSAKYARTKDVEVTIADSGETLCICIQDFGQGFPMEKEYSAASKGIGLFSIRERAEYLGGEAVIRSVPGEGTSVSVTIPIVS